MASPLPVIDPAGGWATSFTDEFETFTPAKCYLDIVPDEIHLQILSLVPSWKTHVLMANAYPRWRRILQEFRFTKQRYSTAHFPHIHRIFTDSGATNRELVFIIENGSIISMQLQPSEYYMKYIGVEVEPEESAMWNTELGELGGVLDDRIIHPRSLELKRPPMAPGGLRGLIFNRDLTKVFNRDPTKVLKGIGMLYSWGHQGQLEYPQLVGGGHWGFFMTTEGDGSIRLLEPQTLTLLSIREMVELSVQNIYGDKNFHGCKRIRATLEPLSSDNAEFFNLGGVVEKLDFEFGGTMASRLGTIDFSFEFNRSAKLSC